MSDRDREEPDLEVIDLEDTTHNRPQRRGRAPGRAETERESTRRPVLGSGSRWRPLSMTLAVAALSAGAGVVATLAVTHRRLGDQSVAEAPQPTPTSTTTFPGFDDGTWLVNKQVQPGRYENDRGPGCFWARLKDTNSLEDMLQGDNAQGHAIVDILPSDGAFQSTACGRWSIYTAEPKLLTKFDDGTWAVNTDVAPGRYRSSGGNFCYWQRRSNFEIDRTGVIAEKQFNTGSGLVQLSPSDVVFVSVNCGHWTRIG